MELALYCPDYGYYEKEEDTVGRRGDFYTSVSVGSLFGELLAFQFGNWLDEISEREMPAGQKKNLQIVEAGAHNGQLACDLLLWLQKHRPELFQTLEYCIIEPSPRRRRWQERTLEMFPNARWLQGFDDSGAPRFNGIIFSNELLDAMPVNRIGWDAKKGQWFEWGVTIENKSFRWTRLPESCSTALTNHCLPDELLAILPDGFTTEISPAAESWWRSAAHSLECGKLLAVDYGLTAEEFFMPERKDGTLRAYHRHQVKADVLADPGEQDITAHVNFTAIQHIGEAAGLKTEACTTQPKFLMQIIAAASDRQAPGAELFNWTPARVRQIQTLTHPEHLGRAFHVFVQSR